MLPLILGAIGAVGGLISAGTAIANSVNQKTTYDYNVQQTDITREREDNAVQRRVNDLKSAGLSPVLAAGSAAASASAPIQTAPKVEDAGVGIMQGVDMALKLATMDQNMSESKQRIATLKAQEGLQKEKSWTENYNRTWHSSRGLSMNPDNKIRMLYDSETYAAEKIRRMKEEIELKKQRNADAMRRRAKDPSADIKKSYQDYIDQKKDTTRPLQGDITDMLRGR